MKRVALLIRSGYSQKAVMELGKALRRPCAPEASIALLLGLSKAYLALGDVRKADDSAESAGAALARLEAKAEHERLTARHALATFRTSFQRGDDTAMAASANCLSSYVAQSGHAPDALTIETLVELSHWHLYRANRPEARNLLGKATKMEQSTERTDPALRSQVASELTLLDEDCELGSSERLQRLLATFDLNDAAQSVAELLQTSVLLTRHWVELGEDALAKGHAVRALQVADTVEGDYVRTLTALNISDALLRTRYWRDVGPILGRVKAHVSDAPRQTALRIHEAILLRRLGRPAESIKQLTLAEETVRRWNTNRFIAAVLHEKAIALYEIGNQIEAQECIREAIALGELCATPTFLRRSYKAGSVILGQPRLLSLARQMTTRVLRGANRLEVAEHFDINPTY